jgi:predicted transcriptional regulator
MEPMSNVLKVSKQEAIQSLTERGWSRRRIAGELGLNRRTVSRYAAKCTREVTSGSEVAECVGKVPPGMGKKARSRCQELSAVIEKKETIGGQSWFLDI